MENPAVLTHKMYTGDAALRRAVNGLPSYSKQEYSSMATKLYNAMDGWGTNYEEIENVMKKMENDIDVLYLIEAFGVRDGDDLATWLDDDGATDEANKVLETKTKVSKRF